MRVYIILQGIKKNSGQPRFIFRIKIADDRLVRRVRYSSAKTITHLLLLDNPNAPRYIVNGMVNDSEAINLSFHFLSRGIFANAV